MREDDEERVTPRWPIRFAAATILVAIVAGAAIGVWNIRRVQAAAIRVARATELKAQLAGSSSFS